MAQPCSRQASRSICLSCQPTLPGVAEACPLLCRPSQTWFFPKSSQLRLPLLIAQALGFSGPDFQERHLIGCAYHVCAMSQGHRSLTSLEIGCPLDHVSISGPNSCNWGSLRTKHMLLPTQLWARQAVTGIPCLVAIHAFVQTRLKR